MSVLITGASGFAGTHLTELLLQETSDLLIGLTHSRKPQIKSKRLIYEKVNLISHSNIEKVIRQYKPTQIYHLAAVVGVGKLEKNPDLAFKINTVGTLNLLEVVRRFAPKARIINCGSSEQYGIVSRNQMPIHEKTDMNPHTAYGFSKKAQEDVARYYAKKFGLPIIYTRTFHYTGPRQPLGFVFPDFIHQAIRLTIQKGRRKIFKVGNLSVKRDFMDIRDAVRAYLFLMKRGRIGEAYNVCSGKVDSIENYLMKILKSISPSVKIVIDPKKFRKVDVPVFLGSHRKLTAETGWKPKIRIEQTISDMILSIQAVLSQ